MKYNFLIFCLGFMTILSCQPEPRTDFTPEVLAQPLFDVNGNETSIGAVLENHKGKTILIDVWASWCGDCIKSLPKIEKLQNEKPEIVYLFFSVDEEEVKWKNGLSKFMEKYNIQGEQYFFDTGWTKDDSNKFISFAELDWIPRYMVVGKDGRIAKYYAKTIEDKELLSALNQ